MAVNESVVGLALDLVGGHGEEREPFLVVDERDVVDKVRWWRRMMPRVEPFYAVKCFNDAVLLERMIKEGMGFDCASQSEIAQVLELGARPDKVIFAHPIKATSQIRYARKVGVQRMTFDSTDELYKVKESFPDAELLVRILPDDSAAVCRLGQKYGAHVDVVPSLLQTAKDLELNVVGIAYHVGSGSTRVSAFTDAAKLARKAYEIGREEGFDLKLIDIGGGFPGESSASWKGRDKQDMTFLNIAVELQPLLDELFPERDGFRLIAEPGRYFACSAGVLFAQVMGRRTPLYRNDGSVLEDEVRYYVNDGVYGGFNNLIYDHAETACLTLSSLAKGLKRGGRASGGGDDSENHSASGYSSSATDDDYDDDSNSYILETASIWGPTCDGLDCILKNARLPRLKEGDWLAFPDMGAYTIVAGSVFNGFPYAKAHHVLCQDESPEEAER